MDYNTKNVEIQLIGYTFNFNNKCLIFNKKTSYQNDLLSINISTIWTYLLLLGNIYVLGLSKLIWTFFNLGVESDYWITKMKIEKIEIKNFRLLNDICLLLEENTTLIVGRNNSGKTSLAELFTRLLTEGSPRFSLEDFSLSIQDNFIKSFLLMKEGKEEIEIRSELPFINTRITFTYDKESIDLGVLSDLIIDLDPESNKAIVSINYELDNGKIDKFFEGLEYSSESVTAKEKKLFFKKIKERIPEFYNTSLLAIDPTDETNTKEIELSKLKSILQPGFISAHRRIEDAPHGESSILSKTLEKLLQASQEESKTDGTKSTAENLNDAVEDIQSAMDGDFKKELEKLLPALKLFGYPGLDDTALQTETTLDVLKLLENNTKIKYPSENGVGLPETYNGLGTRNLIYILFKIYEFFKLSQSSVVSSGIQLVFIEEPEAHLHPQMQEVFIRKINEITNKFAEQNGDSGWPVQFIVTTHSSHIANEAPFETIRYFLCSKKPTPQTTIKDLRMHFETDGLEDDKKFLQKYLTLTRCDLFFADKALLIEGPTERILMPQMISILEKSNKIENDLSSQYVTCIEVGGAYAHRFINLLEYLEVKTLIITDLDSTKTKEGKRKTCKVFEGEFTSNACIQKWFNDPNISPQLLLGKSVGEKICKKVRLAYQIPEQSGSACGRSFEDAFMLTNPVKFLISGSTPEDKAIEAWKAVEKVGKTDFALKYAIDETDWIVPRYIEEGLIWLSESTIPDQSETA